MCYLMPCICRKVGTTNVVSELRQQSKKAEHENEVRRELVVGWLEESANQPGNSVGFALCEIAWDRGCWGRATHGHEPLTRKRGGSVTDRGNVLLTCLHCHEAVHANPQEAEARGFLKPSET